MANLALPDDPYVDGLGTVVPPKGDSIDQLAGRAREILPSLERFKPVKVRRKDETPEKDVKIQAGVASVVAFRLMGFEIIDIAEFFDTSVVKIEEMLSKESAQRTFEMMFFNIINNNADSLQGRISSYAHKAVDTVVTLMDDEKTRGDVRLKAAQDILDRSGANAEQFFNAGNGSNKSEDELVITFMHEGDEKDRVDVTIKRK